jgi:hypothetical protein
MRSRISIITLMAAAIAGVVLATPASAGTECVNTGPMTTICQRPGNAQITTSPNTVNMFPGGFGFGGLIIGGFGIGWG